MTTIEEQIRKKLKSMHSDLDAARADVEVMIEDQVVLLKEVPTANPERLQVLQCVGQRLDAASAKLDEIVGDSEGRN